MPQIQSGQTLGPYRIIDQIGKGGMATVYKAYHAAMDRYVAVKILSGDMAQDELLKGRFQQEARLIANLEHAHILPVHDFGEIDGIYYIVMRYLDMGTLKDRIESGVLPLEEIDHIFSQLADALGYAHDHGVLHRDIKPSNALMDNRGNVFLTDFGIAKIMEGTTQFTVSGTITGTPAYMSPEQAQGETLDPRSDVYSLGIILYEMVTGRVPFEAETPLAVILKHLQEPLPLPSRIRPDTHPAIERVLLKALAKSRDHRYANCQEFLASWKRALAEAAAASPTHPEAQHSSTQLQDLEPRSEAPTMIEASSDQVASLEAAQPRAQPLPASRTRSLIWAGGIIIAGIILVSAVIWLGMRLVSAVTAPAVTEDAAPVTAAGSTALLTPAAQIDSGASFSSWSSANLITIVELSDDNQSIYTAGPGGVTVWDRQDGSVLRRITAADGIRNTHINAIFFEDDQQVWVGTEEGLYRLDNGQVTTYSTEDGLDSDTIAAIIPLRGQILAGTQYSDQVGGGLNVFDNQGWRPYDPAFPSVQPDSADQNQLSNAVTALLDDGTDVWVGTNHGLGRYDGERWTQYHVEDGLPSENVFTLFLDHMGQLWAGTEGGAAVFNESKFSSLPQGPSDGVFGIAESPVGVYWFSGGGGIWRYDSSNSDWQVFSTETGDLPVYETYRAQAGPDGNIYVGSHGAGLVVVKPDLTVETWAVPNSPFGASFSDILPGPDGKLWFLASNAASVDVFDPQSNQWSRPLQELPGFPIYFDDQNRLWMNEWPSGVWVVSPSGEMTHITDRQGLPAEAFVNSVSVSGETSWIGTSLGLAEFDGTQIINFLSGTQIGLQEDEIFQVFADVNQTHWVRSSYDFARGNADGSWDVFDAQNPPRDAWTQVFDLARDQQGRLWVATSEGAFSFDIDTGWTLYTFGDPNVKLPSQTILCVTPAPDGSVWFGTDRGAARFDGSGWQSFSAGPEGLISAYVNDILVSGSGEVFFATTGGMTRLQP